MNCIHLFNYSVNVFNYNELYSTV